MTRVFDASCALVWAAWTDPRHVPLWMLGPDGWTMPICEIDLRTGGAWRFVWRRTDGSEMSMSGLYKEIVPPERLVSTEAWSGDWPETTNTLTLVEEGGAPDGGAPRTLLTQRVLYPSREARDAALATGMREGTSQSFERLDNHLPTMS